MGRIAQQSQTIGQDTSHHLNTENARGEYNGQFQTFLNRFGIHSTFRIFIHLKPSLIGVWKKAAP
jgi:hypothetical protein